MARIAITIGLLFSLVVLVSGIGSTLQNMDLPEAPEKAQTRPVSNVEAENIRFYPPVPSALPDLSKGYLFNEARGLEVENAEVQDEEEIGPSQKIALADLVYVGSVISGENKKAILSYPAPPPENANLRGRRLASRGTTEREYARVGPGERVGEFTVAAVQPDRIILEKDGRKVEKYLTDPEKNRLPPPPQAGGSPQDLRRSRPRAVPPPAVPAPAVRQEPHRGQVPNRPAPRRGVTSSRPSLVPKRPAPVPGGG